MQDDEQPKRSGWGSALGLIPGIAGGVIAGDWVGEQLTADRAPIDDQTAMFLADDPRHGPELLNEHAGFGTVVMGALAGGAAGWKLGGSFPAATGALVAGGLGVWALNSGLHRLSELDAPIGLNEDFPGDQFGVLVG